jgi:uncharacterized membrane protein
VDRFWLQIISIIAVFVLGYGVVKLADFIEWLRHRNMPKIIKYPLVAILFVAALIVVILLNL